MKRHFKKRVRLNLDVTHRCPLECPNCQRQTSFTNHGLVPHGRDLSAIEIDMIAKHFKDIGLEVIYLGFHNASKGKAKICNQQDINLMIEDNPTYALNCAKKDINVYLFDAPWNRNGFEEMHENITRIYGWKDILEGVENRN